MVPVPMQPPIIRRLTMNLKSESLVSSYNDLECGVPLIFYGSQPWYVVQYTNPKYVLYDS